MRKQFRSCLIGWSLSMTLAGASSGATIEVPQDYATITEALVVAQAGDTVLVDDGFYHESVYIEPGVALVSRNHRGAQISGPAQGAPVVRFTGTGQPSDSAALISGCVVSNSYEFGPPPLWSENPNAVAEDCWIAGGGPGCWLNPVVYMPSGGTVRNCRVSSIRWTNFFASTEPGAYMLVEGCLIEEPCFPLTLSDFGAGSVTVFRNNTFDRPEGSLERQGPDFTMLFVNNIFVEHRLCYTGRAVPDGLEFQYNCFDYWIPMEYGGCPGADGPGNIGAEPLFCQESGKSWWLTPESPCVGSGENGEDMGAPFGVCGVTGIDGELPSASSQYRTWPNPASHQVHVAFPPNATLYLQLDGAPLMARVLDAAGRLVAVAHGHLEGEETEFVWDTRLQNGDLAPAGIYYLQPVVEPGTRTSSARITVVR